MDASDKRETDSVNHSYPHSSDVDQESSSVEDSGKEASKTNGDTSDPDTVIRTVGRTCDEQTQNTDEDNGDTLQSAHLPANSQELTKTDRPIQEHESTSSSDISTGSNDHSPSHPVSLNQSDSTNPAMTSESGDKSSIAVKNSTQSTEQRMDSEAVSKSVPVSDGSDRKQLPIKHDVVQDSSGGVYSTVVSPLTSRSTVSPLNTLSLDQEMEQLKEPEEMVQGQDFDENEGKSHLLKSAGVHLCSESSSSSEPPNADIERKLPPPSSESIEGKPLPVVYDRSLEQFSEILLDSDVSLSDDESQDALSENASKSKVEKRVRFADEVKDTCTSAVTKQTENSTGPGL